MEITFGMGARVFWSYVWRMMLWSLLFGFAVGVIIALLPSLKFLNNLMSTVGLVFGFIALGTAFRKDYKHYRVALVDESGAERPRRFGDTLRLWWSQTWRSSLVILVFFVLLIASVGLGAPDKEKVKARMLYTECQTQLKLYQDSVNQPSQQAQTDAATRRYHELSCPTILSQPEPEKVPLVSPAMIIGIVTGSILGVLIQIKIFQILLHKQYRHFRVQVTPHGARA